jgi:hypothetical protein
MGTAGSNRFICEPMMGSIAHGGRRANQACFRNTLVAQRRNNQDECPPVPSIKMLGQAVYSTISMSWLHLTACRYADQIWRISVARRSDICASTRAAIRTCVHIYRLAHMRPLRVNSNFLIRAAIVEDEWVSDC